jgi:hypothetical protein
MNNVTYEVIREFTAGILAGITITTVGTVAYEVGREYRECVGKGAYVILACKAVNGGGK